MEITLDQLGTGEAAVVKDLTTEPALTRRLKSFGLIPGTLVCCRYKSPCGRVVSLELRGSVLALRSRDLKKIRGVLYE